MRFILKKTVFLYKLFCLLQHRISHKLLIKTLTRLIYSRLKNIIPCLVNIMISKVENFQAQRKRMKASS